MISARPVGRLDVAGLFLKDFAAARTFGYIPLDLKFLDKDLVYSMSIFRIFLSLLLVVSCNIRFVTL